MKRNECVCVVCVCVCVCVCMCVCVCVCVCACNVTVHQNGQFVICRHENRDFQYNSRPDKAKHSFCFANLIKR